MLLGLAGTYRPASTAVCSDPLLRTLRVHGQSRTTSSQKLRRAALQPRAEATHAAAPPASASDTADTADSGTAAAAAAAAADTAAAADAAAAADTATAAAAHAAAAAE